MNVEESMKAIQKLQAEMNHSATLAQAAGDRYQAHMTLYNVAVQQNELQTAEAERLILHAQLDAILDAGFEVFSRKRMMAEIISNVHE